MSTRIFTDSTSDISVAEKELFHIETLPLHVILGDTDHLDGVDVTEDQLFAYANETKTLPKTAAVGLNDFIQAFRKALDEGYDDLIYTGLSSKLSSTYNNACLARDTLVDEGYDAKRFHLVDSLQLSTGEGHLLHTAAEVLASGGSAAEAEEAMLAVRPRIVTSFVADTLTYLHMGGRCSSIAYLAGSMLKLHPQINMIDGAMSAGEKYRGKMNQCVETYFRNIVLNRLDHIDKKRIFVTTTMNEEDTHAWAEKVRALNYFDEVLEEHAGATISSHCGPNTIGFLYITK